MFRDLTLEHQSNLDLNTILNLGGGGGHLLSQIGSSNGHYLKAQVHRDRKNGSEIFKFYSQISRVSQNDTKYL